MKKDDFIRPVVMLSLICFITTLLLAATNELTAPIIARQEQDALNLQMQVIFPEGERFDLLELSPEKAEKISSGDADVNSIYVAKSKTDKIIGYVFLSSANGYAGKVIASVGISVDGKIVMTAFSAPDETPGLGKRIEEEKFSAEWAGLSTQVPVIIGSSGEGQSIDAVSGATISSKGAVNAVNASMSAFVYLSEEGSLS